MPDDDAPRGWPPRFLASRVDRSALLVLASLPSLTPRRLHAGAWREGSASGCLAAVRSGRLGTSADRDAAARLRAEFVGATIERLGLRVIAPGSREYLAVLEDLPDPPVALFARGRDLCGVVPGVAVVGARNCTPLGSEVARSLGAGLARSGACVVSGAARGIDRASHEGALDAGGPTIAVLGCGHDRATRSQISLLQRIERVGAVVSEYPPGSPAEPRHFPARNRLIACLARGVVIVEGAGRSGSLITADHALSLGRDVLAVPGAITSPMSEVPNDLIRDGATLVRGADDVVRDLRLGSPGEPSIPREARLEGDEALVYPHVTTAVLAETVAATTRLSPGRVRAALTSLELRGLIRCVGGRFERRLPGGVPGSALLERPREVVDQVLGGLEPDRHPQ